MAIGDLITAQDFNEIQEKTENILGVGSQNFGYGQTVNSYQVSDGDKVKADDWINLQRDLVNINVHQSGTVPSLPAISSGGKIKFDATNEPYTRYLSFVNTLQANRFNVSSFATTNHGGPADFTSPWKNSLSCFVTIEFDAAEQARNFFNAGGKIRFFSSRSGGTTTGGASTIRAQNENWTSLLDGASPAEFGGGTSLTLNGSNYFGCTNSYTSPFFSETGTSVYSANDWTIYARTPDVADNNNGTATKIEFRVEWNDDHTPKGVSTLDGVDGTLTLSVDTVDPVSFALVPAGIGNFTITPPNTALTVFTAITGT